MGPTPFALVNALWSPLDAASATRSGVMMDKMASPALGPTPLTLVSILKQLRCSSVAKPYSETSFSVTFITVYTVPSRPGAGRLSAVVRGTCTA